jgi:hypothetical protein
MTGIVVPMFTSIFTPIFIWATKTGPITLKSWRAHSCVPHRDFSRCFFLPRHKCPHKCGHGTLRACATGAQASEPGYRLFFNSPITPLMRSFASVIDFTMS